jgi:hypothetical protein
MKKRPIRWIRSTCGKINIRGFETELSENKSSPVMVVVPKSSPIFPRVSGSNKPVKSASMVSPVLLGRAGRSTIQSVGHERALVDDLSAESFNYRL